MQTRAAARKLAEAASDPAATIPVLLVALQGQNQTLADSTTEPINSLDHGSLDHGNTVITGAKRKRTTKMQTQPLKGGWVLPHGMGVGLTSVTTSSIQRAGSTLPALPIEGFPTDTEGPDHRDILVALAPSAAKNNAISQTKQTRVSLRVTKAGAKAEEYDQKQQPEPIVKLEGPIVDNVDSFIKQEDQRPAKRARASPQRTDNATDIPAWERRALVFTQAKTEEKSASAQTARKVLIIKGVVIKNSVVTKASDKIIVDTTRLLDPNYRIIVKRGKENPYGLTPGFSPYPYRRVPTPEACEEVHKILTDLHGEVKQPEKMPAASLEIAGCGEVPCVLDALLRTLISGNTLMAAADAAIKNLAQHYGTRQEGTGAGSINWDKVRLSPHQELVQVIRVAGNGPKKGQHIKQILDMVYEENLQRAKDQSAAVEDPLSLDHMHLMSKDEAMAKFVSFPGIGIKTAACVTLFCLRMPCFAVDTHVHKFCRWLGWIPEKADPDNCFRHGEFMVPDHLKYGLHQLFIRHGQQCFKCRKATKPGTKDWSEAPECPLEHLLDRSKNEAGSGGNQKTKKKEGEAEEGMGAKEDDVGGAENEQNGE